MKAFWDSVREGNWLTASRLRGYGVMMLAMSAAALLIWTALSDGLNDRNGKPLGTDFSSFYTAGQLAREGRAADAYRPELHHARQRALFGDATPYYAWAYPPIFLLIAAPLSALPYPLALALWLLGGFALYLGAMSQIVRTTGVAASTWIVLAAGFPAVAINTGHGQNGFLTAAIFAAALTGLRTHPLRAGALFALLTYKPQFVLLVPFALLAARRWRVIASGAITLAGVLILTTMVFGTDAWLAFAASSETARHVLLEQGAVGYEKLQSAFAAVRLWGGSVSLAYGVQAVVAAISLGTVVWVWRKPGTDAQKAAVLLTATLLASPHVLDYDLMLLAPAIAFLVCARWNDGFETYDISLMAFAWVAPLLARLTAASLSIPLGFMAIAALFATALRRQASRSRDDGIKQST